MPRTPRARRLRRPSLFLRTVPGLLLVGLLTIVIAIGLNIALDTGRAPNMPQVVEVAGRGMPLSPTAAAAMKVDGVGFPDWSRWGWRITGGRTDTFGQFLGSDRRTATAVYRKGSRRIAYTVVEGLDSIEDRQPIFAKQRNPPEGKTELVLGGSSGGFPPSGTQGDFGYDCGECGLSDPPLASPHLTVRRKFRGRTVVLTGWPFTDRHFKEMQDMALRTAD